MLSLKRTNKQIPSGSKTKHAPVTNYQVAKKSRKAEYVRRTHSLHCLQWWLQAFYGVKVRSPCYDLGKKEGKLGCVQDIQLFLWARGNLVVWEGLSGNSWQHDAWGHVHRLAHGIGNYSETHGWPAARYSTQHCWVRPELLTDTPSAFSLQTAFTVQTQLTKRDERFQSMKGFICDVMFQISFSDPSCARSNMAKI